MPEGRPEAPDPALFAGDERFRLLSFVGRGGTGAVYRVFDRELKSAVALKAIQPRAAEQIYRLKQEFRALAGIVHPNLIQLHDLVVSEDACYFTMEFVEGLDFVEHVRRGAGDDAPDAVLRRFHDVAPQLVRGLAAVHAADRLHRDVKPPNVRVDLAGRVVILDFDLAAPMDEVGVPEDAAGELAGTFAYMAPEQLWGLKLSSAADWYAVGVVFHEALTGRLPFGGQPPMSVGAPPGEVELREWDPSLPERLAELVAALLHPEPLERPGPDEILEGLGAARAPRERERPRRIPQGRVDFVGRDRELAQLRCILRDRDGTRVAGIHGASGIGKTELVRRFLLDVEGEGDAVILPGRCHPQESVPFKALDPIVDALSRYLLALDEATLGELLPQGAPALAQLFPVLARVPMPAESGDGAGLDVIEARRRGVGALRELLRRIARARPLVVWIDDAQWSDADSAGLLGELLHPPAAPPLLMLLSYRSEDRDRVELVRIVRELAGDFSALSFEELVLEPLAAEETMDLAWRLCPPELASRPQLESLVAESGGSPFLLAEMMWHLITRPATGPAAGPEALRLGDVLSRRFGELPEPERRILELVSVCGRPTERSLVLEAARLGERGRPLVQRLEGLGLVRTAPVGEGSGVETYHDRIREAVSARLSLAELSERHRDLALAFEAREGTEPELLAHHFHGAGELPKATRYALRAAERAAEAFAFLRAADFYRAARQWDPPDAEGERALLAREADALSKATHLVEGGRLFLRAAEGAPRLEGLELRRRAAEHLISGGDTAGGLAALEALLADLGLRYPRTPQRALLGALARLAVAALGGIERPGTADALEQEERIRIDTCYGAGKILVDTDSARGIYLTVVSLARALRAREPLRMARSLCVVGGSISVVGGPLARVGERMMRRAEAIAEELASPAVWGLIDASRGQVLMLAGRCRDAVDRCDAGVRRLSEECHGHALECNVGRAMALRALEELGRMDEMEARSQELVDAAVAAGNRYSETQGSFFLAIARIARGDVAGARELARHGLELWARAEFDLLHFYAVRIQALCDLYEERPREGWGRLREVEPALRRSGLLRIPLARIDALSLRAQLALALAHGDRAQRDAWLRTCERDLRRLERERRADAALHVRLLRGGAAALRGDAQRAVAQLDEAIRIGESGDMALRAACARLRKSELQADADAAARARAAMLQCGVGSPELWAGIYAPGFAASG